MLVITLRAPPHPYAGRGILLACYEGGYRAGQRQAEADYGPGVPPQGEPLAGLDGEALAAWCEGCAAAWADAGRPWLSEWDAGMPYTGHR